jgi:hypothetical protein
MFQQLNKLNIDNKDNKDSTTDSYNTTSESDSELDYESTISTISPKSTKSTKSYKYPYANYMMEKHDKRDKSQKQENINHDYMERKKTLTEKAMKFKEAIMNNPKYANLSMADLIMKAKKWAKKYNLTDSEFDYFFESIKNENPQNNMYHPPMTEMGRLLGNSINPVNTKMEVQDPEQIEIVQDIIKMYEKSRMLGDNVKQQSRAYTDCAMQALTGQYDPNTKSSFSYISPLLAALFIPKIEIFDKLMLRADISELVNARYNNLAMTEENWELFSHLVSDPNETVCVTNKESRLEDLRHRFKAQQELWKNVLDLREGRYFAQNSLALKQELFNCTNGLFDVPDMAKVRDEGTMLRKLLSVFSIRPTVICVSSINTGAYNPSHNVMSGNYDISALKSGSHPQYTTMPIVNLRLPYNTPMEENGKPASISLESALSQPEWFVDNKMIVAKVKTIVYSRDVIMFYANRRKSVPNITTQNAITFNMLPTNTYIESINDTPIVYDPNGLVIGHDTFQLRSVLFMETLVANPNIISGISAGIATQVDASIGMLNPSCFLYNPAQAIYKFETPDNKFASNAPVSEIHPLLDINGVMSFYNRAVKRGTIYVWTK